MKISQFFPPSNLHTPPEFQVAWRPVTFLKVIHANKAWVNSCSTVEKKDPAECLLKKKTQSRKYPTKPTRIVTLFENISPITPESLSSIKEKGKTTIDAAARGHLIIFKPLSIKPEIETLLSSIHGVWFFPRYLLALWTSGQRRVNSWPDWGPLHWAQRAFRLAHLEFQPCK